MKCKLYFLIFLSILSILFIVLISKSGYSISYSDYTKPRKCSDIFGNCADDNVNDTCLPDCKGNGGNPGGASEVREVYINATAVIPGGWINATCEFDEITGGTQYEYLWYYNGSGWYTLGSWTAVTDSILNRSVIFKVNVTEGMHVVRCGISAGMESGYCADGPALWDTDDVNFTVTDHLKYTFWNLTNYTTGSTIPDGANLTRNDKINASAKWNKDLSSALIQHNGNGTFYNYTFSKTGNWTNYTLDLSSTTEFTNYGLINVSYIWANDTYGLDNTTSPSKYFYLWGIARIDQMTLSDTYVYNNTQIQISCRVKDNHTNDGIGGYTVKFFRNDTLIGQNTTNINTGLAYFTHTATATAYPQNYIYKCNITDNTTKFYYASSENYNETTVTVAEFGSLNDCSVLDQAGATYKLTSNIIDAVNTTPTWACMNFTAQNVILDCQGNTVDGIDNTNSYGVYSNKFNSTIKNCTLSDWYYGIYFYSADNGTIQDVTVNNSYDGVYMASASNYNKFTNVSIIDNSFYGLFILNSINNTFTDITVNNNSYYGIFVWVSSNYNTFTSVLASNNDYGIVVREASNNNFNNITASNNNKGVYLWLDYNYNYNSITGGSIHNNKDYDYYLKNVTSTNYFRNTNFTDSRTVYFLDNAAWFNYNNETTGNIWLKTKSSVANINITRKLVSWNNTLMVWNDTPYSGTPTMTYNITGLNVIRPYKIFNNSIWTYSYITDSSGNLPSFTIYLGSQHQIKVQQGGLSKVDVITLNKSLIYNGTSVKSFCKIINANTSTPIENYNVSFYRNDNFLGWSLTNSSGYANISFTDTTNNPPSSYTIKCNITDEPSLSYNASEFNSNTTTLTIIDLGIQAFAIPVSVTFGNSVEIKANITGNASAITSVQASIAFTNISNGKLVQASETRNLTFKQSFSSTSQQYNLTYTPPRSGYYTVNVTVNAERQKWNTTSFNVSFGIPSITFVSPNYRVMTNQTFNFTVNISSSSGDIWYTNLTISITNATRINVSTGQTYSLSNLYNISSEMSNLMQWTLRSSDSGLTRITLNVTPQNGSFATDNSIHDVVYPIIEAPTPTNVSINETITAKIIGNVTGINSINFSVFVPYTSQIINASAVYARNETESQCTGETIASGRLTLKDDKGGNATCTPEGDGCNFTIDNTSGTYMTLGQGAYLIIMLDSEQTIERILLYWRNYTALSGPGNATIYYNDSGTWKTISELSGLTSPNTIGYTNITGFSPFKTNAFNMTHMGSVINNVYEFEAYGIPGKVGLCYVYEYNFSSVTRSGTYYFNSTTKTENAIVRQSSSFFANYGYPQITINAPSPVLKGYDFKYNATITAYKGDLRNLTVNITISNTSRANLSTGETWDRSIPEILNGNSNTVSWNLTAINDGVINTSVWVNSTTGMGYYNQSGIFSINVTSEAGNPPNVANFWFKYLWKQTNITNLYTNFTVYANASDDVRMYDSVGGVLVNLTYPGGRNVNLSMSGNPDFGWHTWEYTFEYAQNPLNETGQYRVGIIARDIGGQENVSGTYGNYPAYLTFNVTDNYTLELTSGYSIYMRGENVTIKAKDVNDFYVEDVNWTVNVTKINETHTENNLSTTYIYTIKTYDSEGNYSIFANASKNRNSGVNTFYFDANSTYVIALASLDPTPPTKASPLRITVSLRHDDRGTWPSGSVEGNLICPNNTFSYETFKLFFTAGSGSDNTNCRAPDAYSANFYLYFNYSDEFNNTGELNVSLQTAAQEVVTTPSGPGGGAGPSPPPACTPEATYEINCTDEKDNDCDGATDCADLDCFDFSACIKKIPNFNFNVTPMQIEILQGEDGTIVGSMTNLGNVQLLLTSSVDIEKDCCSVDITPSFTVAEKTTTGFNTTIHVNTSTPPGEYVLNFKLSYYALQNSQPVKVIVKENEIISYILKTITSQLPTIISNINDYKAVGVDVSYLDEKVNEIQKLIEDAKIAVQEDDLDSLKQYNDRIKLYMSQIDAELSNLKFTKTLYENKYNIASGIIIGSIAIYVITRVIYPFAKISLEMTKLKLEEASLVASRVKTEKEYFVRKIDESTFRKIVADTHGKVLRLRSTLDLRKQERVNLIKRRLSPLTLGEFIKSKTKKK